MKNRQGILLISLTMVIVLISIVIYATVAFLGQNVKFNVIRYNKHQALMAAQAGLMNAAYNALNTSTYTSTEAQLITNQWYKYNFIGGGGTGSTSADSWVYIDASASVLQNNSKDVAGWSIINTNPTTSYTINATTPSWNPTNKTIKNIIYNNTQVWTGTSNSGIKLTHPNVSLAANSTTINNIYRFNSAMTSIIVTATLNFSDGSSITRQIFPAVAPTPAPGGTPTQIKVTGKFIDNSSVVTMRQTILASLEVASGIFKVKRYDETTSHLMP